jgi:rhodanese-related sulfurtransferase
MRLPRSAQSFGLAALALLLLAAPARGADKEPFDLISPADLAKALGAPDVKVFDANSASVFAKGHVPGARLIDYDGFKAGELPADKATRVIFYCKNTH